MAATESLRQVAHARAPLSAWFGIVLLFALFGVIVLAIIGPSPRRSDYEETRAKKRVENLKTLRDEADKALTSYAWVDKNKGVARIPIERAMELTVADLAKQKPAPAGPIATPETQATGGASPAPASPAPAGSPQSGGASPAASPGARSPSPASPSPTKSP
jgi:uncharacterized protein (DUF58 family)